MLGQLVDTGVLRYSAAFLGQTWQARLEAEFGLVAAQATPNFTLY